MRRTLQAILIPFAVSLLTRACNVTTGNGTPLCAENATTCACSVV